MLTKLGNDLSWYRIWARTVHLNNLSLEILGAKGGIGGRGMTCCCSRTEPRFFKVFTDTGRIRRFLWRTPEDAMVHTSHSRGNVPFLRLHLTSRNSDCYCSIVEEESRQKFKDLCYKLRIGRKQNPQALGQSVCGIQRYLKLEFT